MAPGAAHPVDGAAVSLAPTPEEAKWIQAMRRLLRRKPRTIALFGCESGLVALRADERGRLPRRDGAVDSGQVLATLTTDCDGGAW